jgi:CheY-like chemotaxis protein
MMNTPIAHLNRRILVIDDNQAIHADFRKILGETDTEDAALQAAEARIFGAPHTMLFEIDTASQGEEGLKMVEQALAEGRPYAMPLWTYACPRAGTASKRRSGSGRSAPIFRW